MKTAHEKMTEKAPKASTAPTRSGHFHCQTTRKEKIMLNQLLADLNACWEAREWAAGKDMETAWAECPRGDWMLWILGKLDYDRKKLVYAACQCGRLSLKYTKDPRVENAYKKAEAWTRGEAVIEEVRSAAYAAADAAHAAYAAKAAAKAAAYAAHAAYAAADAAYAADAAHAAYAAKAAAYAAAKAREQTRNQQADIIRSLVALA